MVTRPAPKTYHRIRTVEALARHLQWALSVELSTVPPYLTALYSVIDPADPAARVLRGVVVEEMLHMMLVGNLLNSIGTDPDLGPQSIPRYPGYMAHHAAGGPFIQLQPLSAELAQSVFMAIEQPEASPTVPAEGDHFQTIGQFYKAIEQGFETCVEELGERGVFGADTGCQHADTYVGGGAGRLFEVHDLASATRAVTEITAQGEGAPYPRPPLPGDEPFGGYDFYGQRPDGTYGPIVGIPWELSHYRRFQQLAIGEVPVPAVYPMAANPSSERLTGSVRGLSELFDATYTLLLSGVEAMLRSPDLRVPFFAVAFPLMQDVMPAVAKLLMQTPLEADADPSLGPTAGPAFRFSPHPLPDIVGQAERLRGDPPALGSLYATTWAATLDRTVAVLKAALLPASRVEEAP